MKQYRCWDLIEDEQPELWSGGTKVYDAAEVDAEIARLKALLQSAQDAAIDAQRFALERLDWVKPSELELHKAALRWCLEARVYLENGELYEHTDNYCPAAVVAPPEYAPLIQESLDAERGAK